MSLERVPLKTPTLPPATHTNTYVLGVDELLLVDPATPHRKEQARLETMLEEKIAAGARIRGLFLTHHHLDHVGHVVRLKQRFGLTVYAHELTRERLAPKIPVDELLDEGDELTLDGRTWRVLHTPGHATGHLCLHADGDLVCGDMVAGEGTIVLDPPEGDLGDYLEQLGRLRDLGQTVLHPAHGPSIPDGVGKLQEYIDHRNMRTDQVRAALHQLGEAKPRQLVPVIYPDLHLLARPIAARQMLCHLQWLVARGEVSNLRGRFRLTES